MNCSNESTPESVTPDALVRLLRGPALRNRTGILLIPPTQWKRVPDIAARLGIGCVDYVETILSGLPSGTTFAGINLAAERQRLDALTDAPGGLDCLLVYNVDLALARLEPPERERFWSIIHEGMPNRSKALILAMPEQADRLLPGEKELEMWKGKGRVASMTIHE